MAAQERKGGGGAELVVSENYRSKTVKNQIFYFISIEGAYPITCCIRINKAPRIDMPLKNSANLENATKAIKYATKEIVFHLR